MKSIDQVHLEEDVSETLNRLRSAMPDQARERSERLALLHSKHVTTPRDAQLSREIEALIQGVAGSATRGTGSCDNAEYATSEDPEGGWRREGAALVVIGESGAGKTTLLKRIFSQRSEFRPYRDRYGNVTSPLVSLVAPSPCTLKQLGRELLRALGYPLARELKEHMVWELVRQQIRVRKVLFIHIDEMQHAVNLMNDAERQKLSDTIKNVMQQPDWPVSFILSGIPALSTFVTRDVQLMRRSRIFEFRNLDFAKDADQVRRTVEHMVNKHAEMKLAAALPDEFINRLFHATDARFGVLIQLVRGAIEQAMFDDASGGEVRSKHFAKAYSQFSGCEPDENVFVRADWHTIHPAAALIRSNPAIAEHPASTRRRKRA